MTDKSFYQKKLTWVGLTFLFWYVNIQTFNYLRGESLAIILELALSVIVFQTIQWADAYEPEPLAALFWVALFGASASIFITDTIYQLIRPDIVGNVFVGFVEESSKAIVLLFVVRAKLIHSWVDGFVYGSLVGLGFSITEDLYYATTDLDPEGMILFRGLNSIFAHSIFTGIIGASIAYAYLTKKKIGYGIASLGVLAHAGWNSFVIFLIANNAALVAFVTPLVFILLALRLRNYEKSGIESRCRSLQNQGLITPNEFLFLTNLPYRKIHRKTYVSREAKKAFDQKINCMIRSQV